MPIYPPGFIPMGYFSTKTQADLQAEGEWHPIVYTENMWWDQYEYFTEATEIEAIFEGNLQMPDALKEAMVLMLDGNYFPIVDSSPLHNQIMNMGVQINLNTYNYGPGSMIFSGNGYMQYYINEFNIIKKDDFVIEMCARASNTSRINPIMANQGGVFDLYLNDNGGITFDWDGIVSGSWTSANHIIGANAFYHIALIRSGSVIHFYRNGAHIGQAQLTPEATLEHASIVMIGSDSNHNFIGFIDNFRILKGYIPYNLAGFTVVDYSITAHVEYLPDGKTMLRTWYDRIGGNADYYYRISPNIVFAYGIESPGNPIRQDVEYYDYETDTVSMQNNSDFDRYFSTMYSDMQHRVYGTIGENSFNSGTEFFELLPNVWTTTTDHEIDIWKSSPGSLYNHRYALIGPGYQNVSGGGDVAIRKSWDFTYNVWNTETDYEGQGFIEHCCSSDNDYQHIFAGGKNDFPGFALGSTADVNFTVDFGLNFAQTSKKAMPVSHVGAGAIGGVIATQQSIFIGIGPGDTNTTFGSHYTHTYNGNADVWTRCIDVPSVGWALGTSNKIKEGQVLIRVGLDASHDPPANEFDGVIRNESYVYDLLTNSYAQKQDFIIKRMAHSSANF